MNADQTTTDDNLNIALILWHHILRNLRGKLDKDLLYTSFQFASLPLDLFQTAAH